MALAAASMPGTAVPALELELPVKAAWTIDLAHLLARRGLRVIMYTTLAGAHAGYAGVPFYARDFEDDWPRVVGLFQGAAAAGLAVRQASLKTTELHDWLCKGGVGETGSRLAIVLVDKHTLMQGSPGETYQGHFVLVCGCSVGGHTLAVMDPADAGGAPRWVPTETVHAARQVFGTDEDVLLVELPADMGESMRCMP